MSIDPNLLEVKNISKFFEMPAGAKNHVLEDVCLTISSDRQTGKIISILAPFGAGKSTLLKIISGIEQPSSGEVLLNKVPYKSGIKKIVYIPESPSSFPWLNVRQNLLFTKDILQKHYIEKDLSDILSLVGLSGYENHFSDEGSLGFRFRISLAKALTVNPLFVLIDDPFKHLDPETKTEILSIVNQVSTELKIVFLFATTNTSEAVKFSSSIFLMKKNPGSIFHQLNLGDVSNKNPEFKNININNEIASLFKKKNLYGEISFSI